MSAAPQESTSIRWAIALTLAVLCIVPVIGMAVSQYVDTRENVAYQCLSEAPAGALDVENALQEASITSMPAGRLCTFRASEGDTVSVQTGWPSTIAGIGATIVAAVSTVVALRARDRHGYVTTLLPAAVITSTWVIVLGSATTVVT